MNEQIESLLNSSSEAGSKNQLSAGQVRNWLSDYLELFKEDLQRFPELAGKPHADVLMADFDPNKQAQFLVAAFVGDTVTFRAGRGKVSTVRRFLERESPLDAASLIGEMGARFFLAEPIITVSRQELARWLNLA